MQLRRKMLAAAISSLALFGLDATVEAQERVEGIGGQIHGHRPRARHGAPFDEGQLGLADLEHVQAAALRGDDHRERRILLPGQARDRVHDDAESDAHRCRS